MFQKIYTVFFLIFVFLSGCSDKPITVDDIVGIGDDISEVFGRDDSDNYGDSESIAMLEIPPSLDNPNYSDSLKVPKSIDASGKILEMSDEQIREIEMKEDIEKKKEWERINRLKEKDSQISKNYNKIHNLYLNR